jgi:hypothetical protein
MSENFQTFLAFLAEQMRRNPEMVRPLDEALLRSIGGLVKNVNVSDKEDLGTETLI